MAAPKTTRWRIEPHTRIKHLILEKYPQAWLPIMAKYNGSIHFLEGVGGLHRITVAADKGYDRAGFVAGCRALNVTPHVAQNERRPGGSALDLRTTGWPGYGVSQPMRKRVEETFGWLKTVGNFRRSRYRGLERTSLAAYLVGAAYNLLRIAKLCPSG